MHPANFFIPSFLKAINENTEQAFRNIMSEPSSGIFTFEMLQPRFCEMLLAEVISSISVIIQYLNSAYWFDFILLYCSDCLGRKF